MKHFYCIKQGSKYVGLRDNNASYVLGFKSVVQARHVQYNMCPDPALELKRVKPILDVTAEVALGLKQLDIHKPIQSPVVIDPDVMLRIPKPPTDLPESMKDGNFHLETLKAEEFICMPFTNHVGIIILNDVIDENIKEIIFECDLVEPIFDTSLFTGLTSSQEDPQY